MFKKTNIQKNILIILILLISFAVLLSGCQTTRTINTTFAQNAKYLFISDLHPEYASNKNLIDYLKQKEKKGYHIFFLGDCDQWPGDYKVIKHISVTGNHEPELMGHPHAIVIDNSTLLIHGHNAEIKANILVRYLYDISDSINRIRKYYTLRKEQSLRSELIITNENDLGSERMSTGEKGDLIKLNKWVIKKFPYVNTVIFGHDHTAYKVILNGIKYLNTGAGFKGEHIVRDVNGKYYFHEFGK